MLPKSKRPKLAVKTIYVGPFQLPLYMRLLPCLQKVGTISAIAHQALPFQFLFNGTLPAPCGRVLASLANPNYGENNTNITKYDHLLAILRNSKFSPSPCDAKTAHCFILRSGLESDLFVCNNLLHVYWLCGSIPLALRLFDGMCVRDVVSWNTLISGFVGSRNFSGGFHSFREMMRCGIRPSQSSFVSVLVASTKLGSLEHLTQIHGKSLKSGFCSDCYVGNALLKGYVELGELDDLRRLLEEICDLNEASLEIVLRGYSYHCALNDAFELFRSSHHVGMHFGPYVVSSLLSLFSSANEINQGLQVHCYITKVGLDLDVSVVNSLTTMYSRSHCLEDAMFLFETCRVRDIVTWNSLLNGFANNAEGDLGVGLVQMLLSSGIKMNESSFASFLSCCAAVTVPNNARKAHSLILKLRHHIDQVTENVILTMYCRSQSLEDATRMIETMKAHDTVSFNLMMSLHRNSGSYEEAIKLFSRAQTKGFEVDELMFAGAIFSCSKLSFISLGNQIHGSIIKAGFNKVLHLRNCLLEMYYHGGRSDDMEKIFSDTEKPDLFSWNMMLMRYAQCGLFVKSVGIWREMEKSGFELNEFSYCALLDSCSCVKTLLTGEQIHARIKKIGIVFDTALMNALLTMYSNCWKMEKALAVFKEISLPDSISWNGLVSGYAQNGFPEESLKFYKTMIEKGIKSSYMTFASIFMSCATVAELKLGLQFHGQVIKRSFESDMPVSNSLITMYAKCSEIKDSQKIFQRIVNKDVITWNAMISAFAHHGYGREAINVFMQMKSSGVRPNNVTFVGILSACGHAGLIAEACYQFNSMTEEHAIEPAEEHYACMVDILCRAGKLAEAKDLIETMPFDPCAIVWRALLSACKENGDVKLAEVSAQRIMHLEPEDSALYVLLSDLYASEGKVDSKVELRSLMENWKVKKEVGCSWISN